MTEKIVGIYLALLVIYVKDQRRIRALKQAASVRFADEMWIAHSSRSRGPALRDRSSDYLTVISRQIVLHPKHDDLYLRIIAAAPAKWTIPARKRGEWTAMLGEKTSR
jgi:hypothetical protein